VPVQVLSKWQEVLVASAAAAAATGKRLSVNWMKVKRLSGSASSGIWLHNMKLEVSKHDAACHGALFTAYRIMQALTMHV